MGLPLLLLSQASHNRLDTNPRLSSQEWESGLQAEGALGACANVSPKENTPAAPHTPPRPSAPQAGENRAGSSAPSGFNLPAQSPLGSRTCPPHFQHRGTAGSRQRRHMAPHLRAGATSAQQACTDKCQLNFCTTLNTLARPHTQLQSAAGTAEPINNPQIHQREQPPRLSTGDKAQRRSARSVCTARSRPALQLAAFESSTRRVNPVPLLRSHYPVGYINVWACTKGSADTVAPTPTRSNTCFSAGEKAEHKSISRAVTQKAAVFQAEWRSK